MQINACEAKNEKQKTRDGVNITGHGGEGGSRTLARLLHHLKL